MVQPERFDLMCINEKGERERIVMIHAAIMGSIERFLSIYIEHTGGNFPLWLSPAQVKVIPIGEAHHAKAVEIYDALKEKNVRTEIDLTDESFGKKIRSAKTGRIPYFIIIGDKDIAAGKVTLESRDHGQIGQLDSAEVIEKIIKEIAEKK
jgi:threonyl-tRNA synthetase